LANVFAPGVIDYEGRMAANYAAGRGLSDEAASTWRAAVAPFIDEQNHSRIIDVGAGTGRFSRLFARSFQAHVIGVEPSHAMLTTAGAGPQPTNLDCVAGCAEHIPLRDKCCDMAWMSHVWHHVRDHRACARELLRVLRHGRTVLIRGTFGDQLDGFPTLFHYWPATRDVCRQLPTIGYTIRIFEECGFTFASHRRVSQTTCGSLGEFAARTRLRADTALALISDVEFEDGQAALEQAASRQHGEVPVIETIELLVFRGSTETRV
jgi:ubiquinone/menaquinone biosynthesis C-methylase UbiE